MLKIKRIYEGYDKSDGFRILVDRLWPRGVTKADAHIDLWLKDIAPSAELRKWFNHDPAKWTEFKKRYKNELQKNTEIVREVKRLVGKYEEVTLVYAAKDALHNDAVVLYNYFNMTEAKNIAEAIQYQAGAAVSKEIISKPSGTVTLFAFDKGQGLSEHTTPYDALVMIIDGRADITVAGEKHEVRTGEMLLMPANLPHALKAVEAFKMTLTMIKSQKEISE